MNNPFEPIGERARWKVIYDLFTNTPDDQTITFATLANALDLDAEHHLRHIRGAVYRAAKELLEINSRAIESVRGEGYRIVTASEQLRLAQNHQRRAGRALTRGKKVVTHVDFNGMDRESRRAFEMAGQAIGALVDMNRRLDTRQRNLEQAMQAVTTRADRSDDEIKDLKARLDRLEKRRSFNA